MIWSCSTTYNYIFRCRNVHGITHYIDIMPMYMFGIILYIYFVTFAYHLFSEIFDSVNICCITHIFICVFFLFIITADSIHVCV